MCCAAMVERTRWRSQRSSTSSRRPSRTASLHFKRRASSKGTRSDWTTTSWVYDGRPPGRDAPRDDRCRDDTLRETAGTVTVYEVTGESNIAAIGRVADGAIGTVLQKLHADPSVRDVEVHTVTSVGYEGC